MAAWYPVLPGLTVKLAHQVNRTYTVAQRSLRLSVRTSDFQSEKTGSTPVGSANAMTQIRSIVRSPLSSSNIALAVVMDEA